MDYDHQFASVLRPGRLWLEFGPLQVYVRATKRFPFGRTFELATVEVRESEQRKGHFTRLLKAAEKFAKENDFDTVYIENVLNSDLADFLDKLDGYERYCHPGDLWSQNAPCFIKTVKSRELANAAA